MTGISVITASLPGRSAMLAECVASVAAQDLLPIEHLIRIDHDRRGSSATRNALLAVASGDWIAVLDDDDIFYPDHLVSLYTAAERNDIVYSFCAVEGRPGWNPNREFAADALRRGNYIPATTLIRTSLLRKLGGWRDSIKCPNGWEDWDLWLRALDAGGRFECVPKMTWCYRFHAGNKTTLGERQAA